MMALSVTLLLLAIVSVCIGIACVLEDNIDAAFLWLLVLMVLGLWAIATKPSNVHLVTCTNSENVVIKTMTGRVTAYKGSNYVSNDTEAYIIPPGTTCVESSPSPQSPQ